MKVATVLDISDPVSIMRKHRGMISVLNKKLITSVSSTLTRAPMTPYMQISQLNTWRMDEQTVTCAFRVLA